MSHGLLGRRAVAPLAAAVLVLALAACGASSGSSSELGTALQQSCKAVSSTLQNGPDPDADPVGHAEAQPIPLRKLSISDAGLKSAVDKLADAYESFANSNGSAAARAQVTSASAKVNAICPGAAS